MKLQPPSATRSMVSALGVHWPDKLTVLLKHHRVRDTGREMIQLQTALSLSAVSLLTKIDTFVWIFEPLNYSFYFCVNRGREACECRAETTRRQQDDNKMTTSEKRGHTWKQVMRCRATRAEAAELKHNVLGLKPWRQNRFSYSMFFCRLCLQKSVWGGGGGVGLKLLDAYKLCCRFKVRRFSCMIHYKSFLWCYSETYETCILEEVDLD